MVHASGSLSAMEAKITSMRTVLAIAGSLREDSWNRRLLHAAAALAPRGLEIRVHEDLRAIALFDEDLEEATGGGPPAVLDLRRRVAAADGLLIATPEYNHSIPGVLKNAVDWLSRPNGRAVLANRAVGIIGATPGGGGTAQAQTALRQALVAAESLVMPAPMIRLAGVHRLFTAAGELTDADARNNLAAYLEAFSRWIDRFARAHEVLDTGRLEAANVLA